MTDSQLRADARWMLDFIAREWQGCAPHSRFARSLPLVLKAYIGDGLPPDIADDDEAATFDWLCSHAVRHVDQGYWDVPPSDDVWWEIGPLSFTCDVNDVDVGECETLAHEWLVGGYALPKLLVPKTRGEFRRLCVALGVSLKEGK